MKTEMEIISWPPSRYLVVLVTTQFQRIGGVFDHFVCVVVSLTFN